jgi:small subunit ribosomal protein S6
MKKYEVMYIVRPNVEKEEVKNIINNFNDIFVKMNSEVLELKEIGLKDLAYEIDHHKKGYYVWLKVNASNEAIAEFNRVVRITETVMRFIVLKEGE